MALPISARQRLARPLRNSEDSRREIRAFHTVPVADWAWREHAAALARSIDALAALLSVPDGDYNVIQSWTSELLATRRRVASLLFALEPFAPFDSANALVVLRLADGAVSNAADALETGVPIPSQGPQSLSEVAEWWRESGSDADRGQALQSAFKMPAVPSDSEGRFRADWVLQHYAYRNSDLLAELIPHLVSLGVPNVTDVLAGLSIVGSVLDCDDPVTAYVALDMFVDRYIVAGPEVSELVDAYLQEIEPALTRTAQIASRAYYAASKGPEVDIEAQAFALVDAYKRTVEGPFRQFSWTLFCLGRGSWEAAPMLGGLRERLTSQGGPLGLIVRDAVIPAIRNSEAHETLTWDGFAETFVTEEGPIKIAQVAFALVLAHSFAQGCEAGYAASHNLSARPDPKGLPSHDESGRSPAWRRVRAFFGTNRLRLTEARLNTRHAYFRVERLEFADINPCFQALLLARRLLPATETFSVGTEGEPGPIIVVSSDGLDATMPVWELAVSTVDQMPLAAFLPANFDARSRTEPLARAIRFAAWIAVDDALSAIDGSPALWVDEVLQLLEVRLQIVELAIKQTASRAAAKSPRLSSALSSVETFRLWLASERPSAYSQVQAHPALLRLREQWDRWGPAPRHPLVEEVDRAGTPQSQPGLREIPESMHYRTL